MQSVLLNRNPKNYYSTLSSTYNNNYGMPQVPFTADSRNNSFDR